MSGTGEEKVRVLVRAGTCVTCPRTPLQVQEEEKPVAADPAMVELEARLNNLRRT
jgi:hypothetical protein